MAFIEWRKALRLGRVMKMAKWNLGLVKFYRVPWEIWKQMKALFGHKSMTEQDLEPYRLPEKQCTILILEGVELKDENTENRTGAEAE